MNVIPTSLAAFTFRACRLVLLALAMLTSTAKAGDIEDVRAADVRRISALINGDAKTLEAVLADDLSYGHSDGRVQTKRELLAALAAGTVTYRSYDGPVPTARIHENTAWLSGVAELEAVASGVTVKLRLRYLAVYTKQGADWRLRAYQSTRAEP